MDRPASVPEIGQIAVACFGTDVHVLRDGALTVAVSGNTAYRIINSAVRIGHGSAAARIDDERPFEAWRDALEGSFALLEGGQSVGATRVARDCTGGVAVYVRRLDCGVAVSTSRRALESLAQTDAVDELALLEAIRFRWQTGCRTLTADITQLAPGEELRVAPDGQTISIARWIEFDFRADGPIDLVAQAELLRKRLTAGLTSLLTESRAPAVLLSGGVDSSVIAALARDIRPDVRCFIAVIDGTDGVEELRRARFVATTLDLHLEEVPIDPARFVRDLPRIVDLLEEPPRNPNNLILLQLYEAMSRQGVDRVINGDGAEMLLGLADTVRVARFADKARRISTLPLSIRRAVANLMRRSDRSAAWRIAAVLDTSKQQFAATLDEIAYPPPIRRALRRWIEDVGGDGGCPSAALLQAASSSPDFEDALHLYQCATVLLSSQRRHECLARSVGIDAVTPFTHSELLQFAASQPRSLRYTTRSRPVLKYLCDSLIHPDIALWPKIGFSVPWRSWIDDQLAPLVREAMSAESLRRVLPPAFHVSVREDGDAEWRWTLLTLHLVLSRPTAVAVPLVEPA